MKRAMLVALALLSSGCTVNVYWTDAVVYGEYAATPKVDGDPVVVPNPFRMPEPKIDRSGTL